MGEQTVNLFFIRACLLVMYATMLMLLILNIAAIRAGAWEPYMGGVFLMSVCNASLMSVVNILFRVLISSGQERVRVYCVVGKKRI